MRQNTETTVTVAETRNKSGEEGRCGSRPWQHAATGPPARTQEGRNGARVEAQAIKDIVFHRVRYKDVLYKTYCLSLI